MAVGIVMRFAQVGKAEYDAVMEHLGLRLHDDNNPNWPQGAVSHVAGAPPEGGWCVVDVWESQAVFDSFVADRLGPALHKAGIEEQPQIAPFEVYNTYRHGR